MMIKYLLMFLFFVGCRSMEPKSIKVEDRLRPPYNYALIEKIDDNIMDYKWSDYDDGYYRTGEKFYETYINVMKETDDMSYKYAYEIYKKQKKQIAQKYKMNGNKILAKKEEVAINEFSPDNLSETEEIITTDENEFAITKDIIIHVDQLKE